MIGLIKKWSLWLAFIGAVLAVTGSLYTSEGMGIIPCTSCWFIRIFMYPQVLILGVALWKKDRNVAFYIVPLAAIGSIIAIWQYAQAPSLTEGILLLPLFGLITFVSIAVLTVLYRKAG